MTEEKLNELKDKYGNDFEVVAMAEEAKDKLVQNLGPALVDGKYVWRESK